MTAFTKIAQTLARKKVYSLIFFMLYVAVLVYLAGVAAVWEDEFYTLNTTSRSLSEVFSQSYHFEAQPPFYFVLLKLWRLIFPTVFFARIFSVLCIAGSVIIFSKLVKLLEEKNNMQWLVVLFMLNPYTVWAALEIRTYSLLILLSLISIYSFIRYYFRNELNYLYLFLVIAVIGLFTQYLYVFLISALAFSVLVFRGWKAFLKLCLYLIPVVLLFCINLFFLFDNISNQQTDMPGFTMLGSVSMIIQSPANLLIGLNSLSDVRWVKLAIVLVFACFAFYLYLSLIRRDKLIGASEPQAEGSFLNKMNLILLSTAIMVLWYLLVFTLLKVPYSDRYMAIVFPFLILFFALIVVASRVLMRLACASVIVFYLVLLLITFVPPIKFYDFQKLTEYVSRIEKPGEPILFYRNTMAMPFEYYYKGSNPLSPLPHPVTFDKDYIINLRDSLEVRLSFDKAVAGSKSFIVISDDNIGYLYSLNMNRKLVNDFIGNNYTASLDTLFYGRSRLYCLRVRRLQVSGR
jgi:uncharacterized membrane protein